MELASIERERLTKQLEAKTEEYFALSESINYERNPVDKLRKGRELKSIANEMDEIEKDLQALELASDSLLRLKRLQSDLHKIDFESVEKSLRKILKDYSKEGCAALLLFQDCSEMGGDLCAARIRELLKRETGEGQLHHIPLVFQASGQVGRMELLRRLGHQLGVESATTHPEVIDVAQKLCGSLKNGSVVLIECGGVDYLCDERDIFRWIIEEFWGQLVQLLTSKAKNFAEIKLVLLLFVDGSLPPDAIPDEHRCTLNGYQKYKLLEIRLKPWKQDEIRLWIARFSGLRLNHSQLDSMADKIYRATKGRPRSVAYELMKQCCPSADG